MTKFLLMVNHDGGVFETPMTEWEPADVTAHFNYYEALSKELTDSGELAGSALHDEGVPGRRYQPGNSRWHRAETGPGVQPVA